MNNNKKYNIYEIISKKRDGDVLSTEEIQFFIDGYVDGSIPDYQAAALLMAIYIRGMNPRESTDLTRIMMLSGDTISPGDVLKSIQGIPTTDPAFGLPAMWIPESKKEEALQANYTVIDLSTVVATHLTELFKKHADELLTRQTTHQLMDNLAESQPKLVEELIPNPLGIGGVQKVLQNLIRERVSIRDLQTICEALADNASITKDPDILTEYVRQRLARTITRPYETEGGKLYVLTLQPELEEKLSKHTQKTEQGSFLALDPEFLHHLIQAVNQEVTKGLGMGHHPLILCSPMIRRHMRRLLERFLPEVVLLSHTELYSSLEIQSIGMIRT